MRLVAMCLLFVVLAIGTCAEEVPSESTRPETVQNFRLIDHLGRAHELYRQADAKAIVLYIQGNGCPIVRQSVPLIKKLRDAYADKGVRFLMVNGNYHDDRKSVAEEAEEFDIDIPILVDSAQIVTRMLGSGRTAEAILINPENWKIEFRGAPDDRFDYGVQRARVDHEWLKDALDAFLAGDEIAVRASETKGCKINFIDPPEEEVTYEQVAPIIRSKCVQCHRDGDVAPFAFSSYRKAKGWSEMMKEVILADRMPPWSADSEVTHYKNDWSLTAEEKKLLVAWADAGAPRSDDSTDYLAEKVEPRSSEWLLGEPDVVLTMEDVYDVPAEGAIEYQLFEIPSGFAEDTWIRGFDLMPGNPRVVHHALVFIQYPDEIKYMEPGVSGGAGGFFAAFVPGARAAFFPENTAKFVPAGARFLLQVHYVATGKPETDQTKLGLYRYEGKPKERIITDAAYSANFEIAPNDRDFEVVAREDYRGPMTLHAVSPHMHYRGSRFSYSARYPDGSVELLASIPAYNFDWQTAYFFQDPISLPAGTVIECKGAFDNSPMNPFNPDPTATVTFGDQTWEEMFIGYMWLSAPVEDFERSAERRKRHFEKRAKERAEAPVEIETTGPALTPETLIGTLWREDQFKFRFLADGVFLVNESIKGKYTIDENYHVVIDVVGQHFELDMIGSGLFFDGQHPIDRLE